MNLPEALRRQREEFHNNVPADIVTLMAEESEKLSQSNILQDCLQTGDAAPDFTLENPSGTSFKLTESLKKGPVILKFFRGDW